MKKSVHILLVEDNPADADLTSETLMSGSADNRFVDRERRC